MCLVPGLTDEGVSFHDVADAGSMAASAPPAPESASAREGAPSLDPDAPAQVVFLGTCGGPVLVPHRSQPAQALIVNGTTYLVEAGGGVLTQLTKAGIPLPSVRHIFLTHYHSDHVAGYPELAILGWIQPLSIKRLDVWGPTVRSMHRSLSALFKGDIASREHAPGAHEIESRRFKDMFFGHDINLKPENRRVTKVFEDDNVRVHAVRVYHGPQAEMPYAYAYRFDVTSGRSTGRSVVFSGDTTPTEAMSRLAKDCDLLVHEVIHPEALERLIQDVEPSRRDLLREAIISIHTEVTDIPKVAKDANARRMILTHLVPAFLPPQEWIESAQRAAATLSVRLDLTVANDLDVVTV